MFKAVGGRTADSDTKQTAQGNLDGERLAFLCSRPTLPVRENKLKKLVYEQLTRELTSDEVSL